MSQIDENNFLLIRRGVRLTSTIEPVIIALDKYFAEVELTAWVTSGERTLGDQLAIIRQYSSRYGVDKEFKEILTCDVMDKIDFGNGKKIFTWQRAWSRLLNIGVIVNPPLPAKPLFDYIRNGVNRKGIEIGYSPHYYGKAFDVGGGLDHNIANELAVIEKAFKDGLKGMKGFLAERKNNAIHVDCIDIRP